jgi:hypothetical protein
MAFKRNTAEMLKRAEEDLAATEQQIAELRRERESLLPDGEVSDLEKLDRQIFDHERQAEVFRDKIPLLQARLESEQTAERARRRAAAIAKAEEILPARMAAIYALARWAKDGIGLVEKLEAASKLKGWPPDLERPYYDDVRNDRFLASLGRAFSGLGTEWSPQRAIDIIGDAAEIEAEHHRSAIDDLKLNPVTGTPVEEAA